MPERKSSGSLKSKPSNGELRAQRTSSSQKLTPKKDEKPTKTPLGGTPTNKPTTTPRSKKPAEPLEVEVEIVSAPVAPAEEESPKKGIKPIYWFAYALITVLAVAAVVWVETENRQREWHLLVGYAWICIMLAVGDGTPKQFFRPIDEANTDGREGYAFCLIAMTSFVSWVMAKSIQNSSKLGAKYGMLGGLAYAAWFVGVFTTGVIVYFLRKQGYYSLPDFINDRYGPLATVIFELTVLYRLYNEVWSNTVVIADFFGDSLSSNWKLAAWVSMAIPAAYTFIGGMRASLYSDALQAVLMCVLLAMTWLAILNQINSNDELQAYAKANHESSSLWTYNPVQGREMFSLEGGMDLFWTGILQGALSYTFMDPALTDRAFLASKGVMVSGFALGCALAVAYVTVFGFIGVYGNMIANCVSEGACSASDLNGADVASVMGGEPSAVATVLGPAYYSLLCLVIITSAMSTLDSTFTAVAKAIGPDLHGFIVKGRPVNPSEADATDVVLGRLAIVVIGVTGTLPLLFDPDELDATTVTGTMVPGLGPPIYMAAFACLVSTAWSGRRTTTKTRPLCFLLPYCFSAALGTVYQMASQTENCQPFKLTTCAAPDWTETPSCSAFAAYYDCVYASGCWDQSDKRQCLATEASLADELGTCDLDCYIGRAQNSRYTTVVDLNGFGIGQGSYKILLGVNFVSAVGALFLFLFAASDDFLEMNLEAAKAKADSEKQSPSP